MSVITREYAQTSTSDWVKCPGCEWLIYAKRLTRNLNVCPECGHHHRLAAGERIAQLVIAPVLRARLTEAPTLAETPRGVGGFGSTGTA